MMKIDLDNEFIYRLKDALYVEFLKDDLDSIKQNLITETHHEDIKYNKKLIKAYKRILKYYGVNYG